MSKIEKLSDRFTETEVDDEVVVMRLDSGEFFSLAGTAAATWRLIDGSRDRGALLSALAGQFRGDEEEMAADVDEFLARLKEMGLVATA